MEFEGRDYNGLFRVSNFIVGVLTGFSGIAQLFRGLNSFLLGLYLIAFGGIVGYLEYNVPMEAYAYASFLFSFIGRGTSYILAALIMQRGSFFGIISSFAIFLIGLIYIVLEFIPSISIPENMNAEGIAITSVEEDIV